MTNKLVISPYTRIVWILLIVGGTILCKSLLLLGMVYLLVILPVIILTKLTNRHIKFIFLGMLPIFFSFVLLYIVIYDANNSGWLFIVNKVMKLTIITAAIQIALSIPNQLLVYTFRAWGLKGESLITLLGTFTVWTDIQTRTDKILTARFARGFIKKRTYWNKIKQLPQVIIPLIVGILRTSTVRAESWQQRDIFGMLENYNPQTRSISKFFNWCLIFLSSTWFGFNLYKTLSIL